MLREISQEFDKLFDLWSSEEDVRLVEHETEFPDRLLEFVNRYGLPALLVIMSEVDFDYSVDFAHDILATLGKVEDKGLHSQIASLFTRCLHSSIPRIRHGAIKGFEALKDTRSIKDIQHAMEKEKLPLLREMLKNLLKKLNSVTE